MALCTEQVVQKRWRHAASGAGILAQFAKAGQDVLACFDAQSIRSLPQTHNSYLQIHVSNVALDDLPAGHPAAEGPTLASRLHPAGRIWRQFHRGLVRENLAFPILLMVLPHAPIPAVAGEAMALNQLPPGLMFISDAEQLL